MKPKATLFMDKIRHLEHRKTVCRRVETLVRQMPNATRFLLYGEHTVEVFFDGVHSKKYSVENNGLELREIQ